MKNVATFLAWLILLCVVGGACSARLLEGSATTLLPSDIAADPGKYDGKHVDVRGYVAVGPENRNIFDSQQGAHSTEYGTTYTQTSRVVGANGGQGSFTSVWQVDANGAAAGKARLITAKDFKVIE